MVGDVVTCGDGRVGQAGALGPHRFRPTWILLGRGRGSSFATGIEGLAAAIRRALGVRSPSADAVEAMRLADPGGTMAREVERVRAERGAVLDLRGGCPMTAPGCPDRCDCPVNLWAWARPAMAAAVAEALLPLREGDRNVVIALGGEVAESFTCPRCGMTSHNPADVREGYCGNCHDWTRDG